MPIPWLFYHAWWGVVSIFNGHRRRLLGYRPGLDDWRLINYQWEQQSCTD